MKPYIIRRLVAVACVAFWIAASLAFYFIMR
ncbi:hypothetical protein 6991_0078 [Klebsiella phage 6991]|nr:hypothetical protein PRB93_gp78 [Klebsiella phage 6991]URY99612.1 hypothetical protein 6991_0078 [Klebsiella phage 6991]